MRPVRALLAALRRAALRLAAAPARQSTLQSIAYGDPAKPYLGMSKEEIIACAGAPHSTL